MIIKVKSKQRKLAILFTFFLLNFITAFTQEVFEKNNKFGLKDSLGKTIVRAKYDLIDPFRNEFYFFSKQLKIKFLKNRRFFVAIVVCLYSFVTNDVLLSLSLSSLISL